MDKADHTLLVVDDDPGIRKQLKWCLSDYSVNACESREEAIDALRRQPAELVLLDLGLPPDPGGVSEGFATLETILELTPDAKVIVITGNDERAHALRAVAMGAYDFYQKPIDPDALLIVVDRALRLRALELENQRLGAELVRSPMDGIVAVSDEMCRVLSTIERVASSDVSTLLLGESGTGKELLARALHRASARRDNELVAINCAAIPDNLLESELFGYEKGAFTGASRQTPGKLEYADQGTLFLDEIGDMPMELQSKLLRFLQERVVERVGGRTSIPVDTRVVAATHKNLQAQIADGHFREDLYYRLSEIVIAVPPLRERDGDIALIARALLARAVESLGKPSKQFSESAMLAMQAHPWPGNVREMENRVKRAVILSDTAVITPTDLELESDDGSTLSLNLKTVRRDAERSAVTQALHMTGFNISKTARLLGITRPTLYDIIERHDIDTGLDETGT